MVCEHLNYYQAHKALTVLARNTASQVGSSARSTEDQPSDYRGQQQTHLSVQDINLNNTCTQIIVTQIF